MADGSKKVNYRQERAFSVENYIERGDKCRKKGCYILAIKNYTTALELDCYVAKAYLGRGFAHLQNCDLDMAIEDYTMAIKVAPNWKDEERREAYYYRGIAYETKGDHNSAKADLAETIELAIKDNGRIDLTIDFYTEAIQLNPNNTNAYCERADTYKKRNNIGDIDNAIADYTKVIKLDPNNTKARNELVTAYYKKDDVDKVIACLTEAIGYNPKNTDLYIDRGNAYAYRGDYDSVTSNYKEATFRLKQNYADACLLCGNAYGKKSDYNSAIEYYNEAIRLNPQSMAAYSGRGYAHMRNGDNYSAIEDYNMAITLEPNDPSLYRDRADVYEKNGECELAKIDRANADKLEAEGVEPHVVWVDNNNDVPSWEKDDDYDDDSSVADVIRRP